MSNSRWKYLSAVVRWAWTQASFEYKVQAELDKHTVQGWELSHIAPTPYAGVLLIFRKPA
ncbi:MAG: hypothetical protein ACJ8OJ_06410 [Povalibacter sp.]|jgi:hypothetical protein